MPCGGEEEAPRLDAELSSNIMQHPTHNININNNNNNEMWTNQHEGEEHKHEEQKNNAQESPSLLHFDAYVVLDFEATCERGRRIAEPEIIEFPMVIVENNINNNENNKINENVEFQRYVRPVVNPVLTDFCTELTGITQAMVEGAQTFPDVLRAALNFLRSRGYGEGPPLRRYLFVTCGDWDLKTMLPSQMYTSGRRGMMTVNDSAPLCLPHSFRQWCNVKKIMKDAGLISNNNNNNNNNNGNNNRNNFDLPEMLAAVGLSLVGQHHSGIDDCRNIAALLRELMRRGVVIEPTTLHENENKLLFSSSSVGLTAGGTPLQSCMREECKVLKREGGNKHANDDIISSCSSSGKKKNKREKREKKNPSIIQRPHVNIIEDEDPLTELLPPPQETNLLLLDTATKVMYSKALARLLRHTADARGLPVTRGGFVRVDDVLKCAPFRRDPAALTHIAVVVHTCEKRRFTLAYDDGRTLYIRANQGHSMEGVDPALRRLAAGAGAGAAVHGTHYAAWREIKACGYVSTMGRNHIHFARGAGAAGGRRGAAVLMFLNVGKVIADGVELWESANGVLLTPGVGRTRRLPLEYFAKVTDRRTGEVLYTHD